MKKFIVKNKKVLIGIAIAIIVIAIFSYYYNKNNSDKKKLDDANKEQIKKILENAQSYIKKPVPEKVPTRIQ